MNDYVKNQIIMFVKHPDFTKVVRLVFTVKNWLEVILVRLGVRKSCILQLRNGLHFQAYPAYFHGVDMFYDQPYKMLGVNGRVVIDVGGFVGDSALYFVKKGARKVIAYEPDDSNCAAFEENLRINAITNVELHRYGATRLSEILVPESVLKIDCEGCEYPLILDASQEVLQNFLEIIMEFHAGSTSIEKKLWTAGFKTRILQMYTEKRGILYAFR